MLELTRMLELVRLTEDELISGFVVTKKGYFYIVLNRKDMDGKRKPLWKSTGLPATEEYRDEAESRCLSVRIQYSVDLKNGLKKSSVAKDYTIINQALNYAVSRKMIEVNPNSAITLHKIEKYNAATLNADQMQLYLEFIQGDIIEIPLLLGGFYGMRRSECVGTRESQFDFRHKFFRANHTITTATIDGEKLYIPSDKLKTDLSNRTYPLIPYVEERIKAKIAENKELRELCGSSYSNEWLGYICVHPLGEIIDPDYITNRHTDLLKKAGLPHIRFHDLRHSCVGLMMANEVPMERIKDWIGHSDIRTTINTYGHLEYQSKKKTAKIIQKSLPLKKGRSC